MAKVDLNKGKTILKQKSRNPIIKFDKLQMYFGYPYVVGDENSAITINIPTIGDIVEFGMGRFYQTVNIFTTNTTSYRLMLWEAGVDWTEISDFDLFTMLYKGIDQDASKFLFGDLDWSKFELFQKQLGDNVTKVLYNKENEIEINEDMYHHFSQYIRCIFNIYPEEKITTDSIMKKWFINKDKREKANEESKENKSDITSSMLATISACVNHPGFKYNVEELKQVNMCQFYDSVKRLQIYENTTALMKGMYSGFVDSKGISADSYNFMKEI